MPRLIKFSCQECGTKLAVPHEMAGLSDNCPKCGALVTSPTLEQWEAMQSKAAAARQKPQGHAKTSPQQKPAGSSAPPASPPAAQGWSATELADALSPKDSSSSLRSSVEENPEPSTVKRQAPTPTVSSLLATSTEPHEDNKQDDPFAEGSATTPAAPESDSPTLLSRVLSTPSASTVSTTDSSVPVSKNEPEQADEVAAQSAHGEATEHALSETESYYNDEEDARQKRGAQYRSPHAPGLGELLANIHTNQEKAGEGTPGNPTRRNSPFIESSVPTKVRKRKRRLIIIGAVLFLAVDLAIVAAYYRKEIVEFWHTKVVRSVPAQEASTPLEQPLPKGAAEAGQDALLNIPAQRRPETKPAESVEPAPDEALSSPDAAPSESEPIGSPPAPSAAVPQAIPITEEQMAKMLEQQSSEKGDSMSAPPPAQMQEPEPAAVDSGTSDPGMAALADSGTGEITASLTAPKLPEMPSLSAPATQPSTPPATVSSSKPLTNKIPPEAQAAFTVVKNFLNAPDWRSRSKWVTNSSSLMQAMERDAQEHGDGPIRVSSIFFSEQYKGVGNPYYMFELSGGDLPHRVMAVVEQTSKKQMLVDWETFNEFRRDKLLKFLENPGSPPAQFRVVLRRKHYFEKDVADVDKKESFQVMQLNVSYEGNVFVPKSSPLISSLATKLPWGMDILVIAELVWKKSEQLEWVEIQSIPYYGWRKS